MKKTITLPFILQSILTPEKVDSVVKLIGYEDKVNKPEAHVGQHSGLFLFVEFHPARK